MPQFNRTDILNFDRELAGRSLSQYTKMCWPNVDPADYVHGWHMDAMCEHLEATANGQIKRLLINVPPGMSKSLETSVIFPSWLWGPNGWPTAKFIGASYAQELATRDNRKTRQIIESEWYQDRWPIGMKRDENQKTSFENMDGGFRQSSAVMSMTGKRGDFIVWDDPLSPEGATSDTIRITANRVFSETLPLRLVSPKSSVIIVIMQRLHENDVSGYILANDFGYEHLMLPMEFEPDRKCYTSIGFADPRTDNGELLFPDRFPQSVVDRDKIVLGSFASAGQMQQRPSPRGGGMFKREDFRVISARPAGYRWVRGWDLAATETTTAARTAGVMIGIGPEKRICIAHCVKAQVNAAGVERLLGSTAAADGKSVSGSIPQDPGSAGKSWSAHLLRTALMGYSYTTSPESGSKETRAMPLASQVEAGNVDVVEGDWLADFLDEAEVFPRGKFKDQVDAATRAFNTLVTQSAYTLDNL